MADQFKPLRKLTRLAWGFKTQEWGIENGLHYRRDVTFQKMRPA